MILQKNNKTAQMIILAVGVLLIAIIFLAAGAQSAAADESVWTASYWNNTQLSGPPVLVQFEQAIDYNWKGLPPAPSVQAEDFSARWVRTLGFSAGTYQFKATMDDGMRVWVDGKLIIDDWNEGRSRTNVADVPLSNGSHTIRVDYFQLGGNAVAGFTWVLIDGGGAPPPSPMPPPGGNPGMPPPGGGMPMPPSGNVIYPVGEVKSPYLNLRQSPSSSSPVIAVLQQNTEVFIMARSSGSTWYLVKTQNGPTGWVKRYFIYTDFPYTSLPIAGAQPMPTPQPPAMPPSFPSGMVNAGALNLRSGPGINNNTIAVVTGGTTVALLGRNNNGSWLKIKTPTGTVGWVNAGYISTDYHIQNLPAG